MIVVAKRGHSPSLSTSNLATKAIHGYETTCARRNAAIDLALDAQV